MAGGGCADGGWGVGGPIGEARPQQSRPQQSRPQQTRAQQSRHQRSRQRAQPHCRKALHHVKYLPMKRAKFILPALTEATSPYWRPIKYSLFPALGLATLAAYLDPDV